MELDWHRLTIWPRAEETREYCTNTGRSNSIIVLQAQGWDYYNSEIRDMKHKEKGELLFINETWCNTKCSTELVSIPIIFRLAPFDEEYPFFKYINIVWRKVKRLKSFPQYLLSTKYCCSIFCDTQQQQQPKYLNNWCTTAVKSRNITA